MFSILPFEVEFFEGKHQYPIHYVGNPTVDEVAAYQEMNPKDFAAFIAANQLENKPVIAALHILYRHGISNQLFNNLTVGNQINQ